MATTAGMTRREADRRADQRERARLNAAGRQAHRAPRVLRAAGVKIELMSSERMRAIAGQRQRWQKLAWGYRDLIGELRSALEFRAQAISRVRFYVAEIMDDDDEPVALALRNEKDDNGQPTERAQKITLDEALCRAAEDELARLPLDAGDDFVGVWSENWDVAGECWLHGWTDPESGDENWEIRSIDDVEVQGTTVTIKDELGQARPVNLNPDSGEELYRLWRKHPKSPYLADSSLNACLDSLEDITLIAREMRAVARSRIAANGIAFLPDGMADTQNQKEDDDRDPRDAFVEDLTAAVVAPISNEGDAGAIAPIFVLAAREDIDAARFERLDREDSPTLIAKLDKALARMGQSIAVPPEIITGMSDVNHWTAWQIDVSTFRYYLEPGIRLMADSLTKCFLRRALAGFPADQVKRVRIWWDAGSITENPNRRQDTLDAIDRTLISPRTGRKELGFGEGDAPTPEEVLQMIAAKSGLDSAVASQILAWAAGQQGADLLPVISAPAQPREIEPPTPASAGPDVTGVGGTGAPDSTPPTVIRAAATREDRPLWTLNSVLGLQLADIERALRDQILLGADAALTRALERAGNRLRSKAQSKPALTASLRGKPVTTWAATMGRDEAFALGADLRFLLKDAFSTLADKFGTWVNRAINAMITRILAFLRLRPDSTEGKATADRVRNAMAGRVDTAWATLHSDLEALAERVMFGDKGEELADGEQTDLAIPVDLVRRALSVIGGLPETAAGIDDKGRVPTGEAATGMADGEAITTELAARGVVAFGREWKYHPELARDTFLPHFDLDGTRFTSWTDDKLRTPIEYAWVGPFFRPKDHQGCLCTTSVTYAVPNVEVAQALPFDGSGGWEVPSNEVDIDRMLADQLRERLAQPSQDMAYAIELAGKDDAAGRRGTVVQRQRAQYEEVQRLKDKFLNGE